MCTGTTAKTDDVQQRVAHQAVAAMNATTYLTYTIQARDISTTIFVDHHPAILIMQGRIDQHGFFSRINTASATQFQELGKTFFQNARLSLLHAGGIQPHATTFFIHPNPSAFSTFAQNSRCNHITRAEFINKTFPMTIQHISADRTNTLGNQGARQMTRISKP